MSGLFAEGETLSTARLRLRVALRGNVEALGPWLAGALAPDWSPDDLAAHVAAGEAFAVDDASGALVGLGVVLVGRPELGGASVPFLAVAPDRRFRGLGGEAALAVERRLRAMGLGRVYAPVPQARGLAVYFWLRLGYRPLTRSQAPWPLAGLAGTSPPGLWLARFADMPR